MRGKNFLRSLKRVCFPLQLSRIIDMDSLRQPETVTVRVHTLNIEPFKIQNLATAIWIRYTYMMVNCKFGGGMSRWVKTISFNRYL